MNNLSKILTTFAVAALVVVCGVLITQQNILESNFSTKIKISETNRVYSSKENIVLTGTSNPESEIIVSWNGQFGLIESDKSGKWIVNLGTMPEGKYSLQMISDDSEKSQSIATAQIIVDNSAKISDKTVSFIDDTFKFFAAAISLSLEGTPDKLITISQSTPPILQGDWKLLK